MSSRSLLLLVGLSLALSNPSGAVTPGQKDTFSDGTTQGWVAGLLGSAPPLPPRNVADGGPGGAGDAFLQVTATGGSGEGSRLAVINVSQWRGIYPGSGVAGIGMSVKNLGETMLQLRLYLSDASQASRAVSTLAIPLPAGSGWVSVEFPLAAADLTPLVGSAAAVLANVAELRVFHSTTATFPPPTIVAVLGIDDVTALPEPDADGDGEPDAEDNCTLVENPAQVDADQDGYGNACDPDFNQDGVVNFVDLARIKSAFFSTDAVADLNGDGVVNFSDLAVVKAFFFKKPGPAAGKP